MAQFASGDAPRMLDAARDDLDADAARQAAAADGDDDGLHVGELGQDLARQQAAVAGDDVVVVEGRDEHQAGSASARRRAAASASS